ncbi:hypothetical protein [Mucilaginibacter sp.]|uniref:hypothetical protein n=1 Tax=Mucilaginibacter sp. TaxID=1882438 RepID=UPI00261E46F0|nr:hypothetical protein [Mucilaginibacter sp.]MDB5128171.1 hypothetical protein [Mucilaginibacter sp.]
MNKLYYKLFMILILAVAISGCKLDPPIYPEGTVANPDGGAITTGGTITYMMDGKTTTVKPAFFQVISSTQLPPNGNTQIGAGSDPQNMFSLTAETTVAGTFDAGIIMVGSLIGEGTVTFTEINAPSGLKGTVKGTFTGKVSDLSGEGEKDITGSFNITM